MRAAISQEPNEGKGAPSMGKRDLRRLIPRMKAAYENGALGRSTGRLPERSRRVPESICRAFFLSLPFSRGWKYVIKMRASFSFKPLGTSSCRHCFSLARYLESLSVSSSAHRLARSPTRRTVIVPTETENEVARNGAKGDGKYDKPVHQLDEQSSLLSKPNDG